uniref:Uncharacterized protein n=1 Tax=Myoviridae sp. ctHMa1 TaxID=2827671 RepID=A0A8S5SG37_9CAUD|nr:MAG TPA: hypothetical protein [Myoviridae sp. ctHMa1]
MSIEFLNNTHLQFVLSYDKVFLQSHKSHLLIRISLIVR